MSDTHAHVAPEPLEAPEPRPARVRDLVKARALLHGYNTLQARERAVIPFWVWVEAYDAVGDYLACHDRRRG